MESQNDNKEVQPICLPFVSIIIPCRNEFEYIARCLDSILANDYPIDKLEILIIDGMSDDKTRQILNEYIQKHPIIKLLDNKARITPVALNIGINKAKGETIMRIDAHNTYPLNYISKLIKWQEQTKADNVGSVLITRPANNTPIAKAIAIALSSPFGVGNSYFRIGSTKPRWVDTVPFGCFKKEVFKRIGMFDEELLRNQDDEFNHRLIKNNGKILLVPDIKPEYFARDSLNKVWNMYFQYGRYKPLVGQKIGRIMTIRQLVPVFFVSLLGTSIILSPFFPLMEKTLILSLFSYLFAILVFSIKPLSQSDISTILRLPVVFPVLHVSYGLGFIKGIWDFIFLKKHKSQLTKDLKTSR